MTDEIKLTLLKGELERLRRELKSQARTFEHRLDRMEKEIIVNSMTYKTGCDEEESDKSLKDLSEVAGNIMSIKGFLNPIRKKLAVVEALLDPDITLWLSVQAGGSGAIVEEFLQDVLGTGYNKVEFAKEEAANEVVDPPTLEVVAEATDGAGDAPPPPPSRKPRSRKITDSTKKQIEEIKKQSNPEEPDQFGEMFKDI